VEHLHRPKSGTFANLAENGRWDEARTQSRKALEIVKDFSPAQLWLGIILYNERKFDEAMREITPTLKDGWNMERGEEYLGKIALARNLPVEAAVAFSKELGLNPALPAGHCGLGRPWYDRERRMQPARSSKKHCVFFPAIRRH
jgi:hypothetical protein